MHNSYKGILYAIITAILWGVLAIVLKISLNSLTPVDITWFRFFLAFVVLAGYYFWKKTSYLRILKRPPLLLIIATLCLAVNYYGFIEGLNLTTPSVAQVFIQLGPVLLAVSGFVIFHEKVNWRQIVGLFLVISGLLIFYREQIQVIVTGRNSWQTGVIWVLIAAVTWAIYSVLLKILVLKHPPMQLNLVIFGLPVLLYLPFIHFSHFTGIGIWGWMILLFLGLNTLFAYGLLALAIQYIEANKISVILVLNPLLTFALMALLGTLGVSWIQPEHYTFITLAGALIVLSGAILTILRKKNRTSKSIVKTND
jgi:drug/metabolite transporter (DMT)-like permease